MTISNETKVGTLTAIAITFMILGFNFLKGKTLLKTGNYIYAKYTDTKGIMISNPVFINGYSVGSVFELENADKNLSSIVVTIKLKDNYNIATNSIARIKENPLGTASIIIALGDSKEYLKTGDTVLTTNAPGLLDNVMTKLTPVTEQITTTLQSLEGVLKNINSIVDPNTKNNLQEVIANINKTTTSLVVSSVSLQSMMNEQSGAITQSMNNVAGFTKNLADNNAKVTNMMSNIEKTTENLSKADIKGSVEQMKASITNLNLILSKLNSRDGSLGKLMNDTALYNNLNNTIRSTNILIDDLRVHPKRYVNVSVFGKKDRTEPLMAPLADSTLKK